MLHPLDRHAGRPSPASTACESGRPPQNVQLTDRPTPRRRIRTTALILIIGSLSCGEEAPTAPDPDPDPVASVVTPTVAIIASAADATAKSVSRVRTEIVRASGLNVLASTIQDVSGAPGSWPIRVEASGLDGESLVVHSHLIHVEGDGTESVQYAGRSDPFTVAAGGTASPPVTAVRGPIANAYGETVEITDALDVIRVGNSHDFQAEATGSQSAPTVFWVALDPDVASMTAGTLTAAAVGRTSIVAVAGMPADTVVVDVLPADSMAPAITSTTPSHGAMDVPFGAVVTATFDESLDASSVTSASFGLTDDSGTPIPATVSYGGQTATLTPASPLPPATTFEAAVTDAITDAAGNGLGAPVTWTFTTLPTPDTTAPSVVSIDPTGGTTRVPLTQIVSVTFDEAIDPATVTASSLTLEDEGGSTVPGAVTTSGDAATFTPDAQLDSLVTYTLTLTTGIADASGNALAAPVTSTFTTTSGYSWWNPDGVAELVGLAIDPDARQFYLYARASNAIPVRTLDGDSVATLQNPTSASTYLDLDVLDIPTTINGVSVPAGALLVYNGATAPGLLVAIDAETGTQLASLVPGSTGAPVGGSVHPTRGTFFSVARDTDTISEIDLSDGSVVATFPVQPDGSPDFAITGWGDLDVDPQSGNLLVGSSSPEPYFRVMTPDGGYVEDLPLRYYLSGETTSFFTDVAGLALDPVSRVVWVARRSGRVVPLEGIFR